jgi:hypothetical protein
MDVIGGSLPKGGGYIIANGRLGRMGQDWQLAGASVATVDSFSRGQAHRGFEGALIGGAFAGPLGAIAGGLVGGRKRAVTTFVVRFANGQNAVCAGTPDEFARTLSASLATTAPPEGPRVVDGQTRHQRVYGFLFGVSKKKQQAYIYDDRIEWAVSADGNSAFVGLDLAIVEEVSIEPATSDAKIICISANGLRYNFVVSRFVSKIVLDTLNGLVIGREDQPASTD